MSDPAARPARRRATRQGADRRRVERRRAERTGRLAERLAAGWLRLKGYRVVARGYRCPVGEIDLIVRRGRILAFVEVKARRTEAAAADSLVPRQRRRIARAAEAFVRTRPDLAGMDWRFDLVYMGAGGRPRHLADAWRPDGP